MGELRPLDFQQTRRHLCSSRIGCESVEVDRVRSVQVAINGLDEERVDTIYLFTRLVAPLDVVGKSDVDQLLRARARIEALNAS